MHRFDRYDSASVSTAAFGASALLIVLTGCAQLTDVLEKRHEEHFETYARAEEGWAGVEIPAWIPSDATDLRNVATNDETVAVIRVTTESDLPEDCSPAARNGIPALDADWSTEEWPDDVALCDGYEVMPYADGWLGWFNATTPGETPAG